MITLDKVSFSYSNDDKIIDSISLELKDNQIGVLLGKNGVGKTTLLHCIDGLLKIDSGKITSTNETIYISDNPILYNYLTGYEYLDVISQLSKIDISEQTNILIKELELKDSMNKLISDFSLGTKHKLALLTSIVLNYKTYLIDEPLTALDPSMQRFMLNYFKKLRGQGHSFLISTHMINIAYELADVVYILKNGKTTKLINNYDNYLTFEKVIIDFL